MRSCLCDGARLARFFVVLLCLCWLVRISRWDCPKCSVVCARARARVCVCVCVCVTRAYVGADQSVLALNCFHIVRLCSLALICCFRLQRGLFWHLHQWFTLLAPPSLACAFRPFVLSRLLWLSCSLAHTHAHALAPSLLRFLPCLFLSPSFPPTFPRPHHAALRLRLALRLLFCLCLASLRRCIFSFLSSVRPMLCPRCGMYVGLYTCAAWRVEMSRHMVRMYTTRVCAEHS